MANAQVRVKKQDRGVYRSPQLTEVLVETLPSRKAAARATQTDPALAELVRDRDPERSAKKNRPPKKLVEVEVDDYRQPDRDDKQVRRDVSERQDPEPISPAGKKSHLAPVKHENVILVSPRQETPHEMGQGTWMEQPVLYDENAVIHDGTCDGCPDCVGGCDAIGCDSMGCDSIGCCGNSWYQDWSNASFSWQKDRWFGGLELLLMWSRGDRLPILVTTSSDDGQ